MRKDGEGTLSRSSLLNRSFVHLVGFYTLDQASLQYWLSWLMRAASDECTGQRSANVRLLLHPY